MLGPSVVSSGRNSRVMKLALSGGEPVKLIDGNTTTTTNGTTGGIAIGANNVYWTTSDGLFANAK